MTWLWWAALAWRESADSFLGTQGVVWDTQWDMMLALIGAIAATVLFAGVHDRSLRALASRGNSDG